MRRIEVISPSPYSLETTIAPFRRFADELVDRAGDGSYRRLVSVGGNSVLVEARQAASGAVELEVLHATTDDPTSLAAGLTVVRRTLALDEDIGAVHELVDSIPEIAPLSTRLAGLRRTIDPSPFEGLTSSILAQLISIRGAATVRARLVERFGTQLEYDGERYWAFPEPHAIAGSTVDELCGEIRMTSAKARAILAVASAVADRRLVYDDLEAMPDEEVITHLTSFPGVGRWTAEWFLVNVMGRMSIVPSGDLGIRRSTGNWFFRGEMPSAAAVTQLYEPFGDLRAYVAYFVLSAERLTVSPGTSQ